MEDTPRKPDAEREDALKSRYRLDTLFDISQELFGVLDAEVILKNVLLTTDGVFEAHNHDDALFGKMRVQAVIRAAAGLSAQGILEAIPATRVRWTPCTGPSIFTEPSRRTSPARCRATIGCCACTSRRAGASAKPL
jgi:hypothetical protein